MRSCAENLARRAWASHKFRQRAALTQLQVLVHHAGLRPVYPRMARRAIQSQDAQRLAEALKDLTAEIRRQQLASAAVRQAYRKLWPCLRQAA